MGFSGDKHVAQAHGAEVDAHVGHGSSVYITMNPAVLSQACAFSWLRM